MIIFPILGSLGGVVAFATAIYVILKAAFAQTQATKENTKAIQNLTSRMDTLSNDMSETRQDVAYLKGRVK